MIASWIKFQLKKINNARFVHLSEQDRNQLFRAVPRMFCLRGQTPHTFTGVSRIQTGFLVGRFVFTHTEKDASKTSKETNHTDAFCLNCHDLLRHKQLV